ncbi:MAG: D-cysteine desulfhydrase family protein [Atribacterota bacterium]|nr:D-cysteine desulfhydrase family protein [Atribacterota bacterium]MDD5637552.1 D-cysteine desulfhydrase family protein [Atribacterota bacterium]
MMDFIKKYKRIPLAILPTPLELAKNLTEMLKGPNIYIKRDNCTGLAFGGNKARKLEYIIADMLEKKADTIVTIGGLQSNWARQTAAAAKKLGLGVILVLNGNEPGEYQGNLLLDSILGCDIRFKPYSDEDEQKEETGETPITGEIAEEVRRNGKIPYIIPLGGCNPMGNLGYINAVKELKQQTEEGGIHIDYIITAVGTGGTQVGIELGLRLYRMHTRCFGISISRHIKPKSQEIAELCNKTIQDFAPGLACRQFYPDEIEVNDDYIGEGYAIPTKEGIQAIHTVAQAEGVILDPVYTGKAMAGLIDLIKKGKFKKNENIVFLHTGGEIANFAYNKIFS